MPNAAVLEQIEFGELIQSVDDGRDPADPFKLTTPIRTPELAKIGQQPRRRRSRCRWPPAR